MTGNSFTRVELAFYPEHLNYWLRFGSPVDRIELDRRRSLAVFEPGQVFGYVRWSANEYGTQDWRLTILAAKEPHIMLSRVPGVSPGVEVLLLVKGKASVRRCLEVLGKLESNGFALEDVSPSYYRHVHVRLTANRKIRSYSLDQHRAHLAAKQVRS